MSPRTSIGSVFGRWRVVEKTETARKVVCLCACGTQRVVRSDHLVGGATLSCGCLHSELASARTPALHKSNTTHGKSKSRAHGIWLGMKQRCLNPNNPAFAYYGARGIKVAKKWMEFSNFLADMGEPPSNHTLERINNNGPYAPKNCKWASRREQSNNRRANRRITINGRTQTLTEWSQESGIHVNTLAQRLDGGIAPDRAIRKQRLVGHPAKVTEADVRAIRESDEPNAALARKYGITPGNVTAIKQRRSWKNVV